MGPWRPGDHRLIMIDDKARERLQLVQVYGKKMSSLTLVVVVFSIDIWLGTALQRQASNNRNWKPEHARLASVQFDGESVMINGVRNFSYDDDGSIEKANYETQIYDLSELQGLWFGVQPFLSDVLGHSFLSFEFEDGVFLVLSVEARQEIGEPYSVIGGLMRQFELIYVWADERDVIGLRSHIRKDNVHLYRIQAPLEEIRSYLIKQLMRTNNLIVTPAFYNTLTQNCTTSLFEMSNVPALKRYSDYRVLFPGYAHRLLHELEAIDTGVGPEEAYARALIDHQRADIMDPAFSTAIRELR